MVALPKPVTLTSFSDGKIYRNIYLYMGSEKVLSPVPSGKDRLLIHLRKKYFHGTQPPFTYSDF